MRPHELKSLVVFDVIIIEKSITQAAKRLSMTQTAVASIMER